MPDDAITPPLGKRRLGALKFGILLAVIATGFLVFKYTPLSRYADLALLKSRLDAVKGHWWAGPAYAGAYAVGCVFGFPGLLMTLVGGLVFGPWWGTLWVVTGSNLGVNAAFFVARLMGKGWLDAKLKGGRLDALNASLAERGFLRVLQLRLVPAVPFNFLNFACGLTKVKWRDYAAASAIGMFPATVAYVYFCGVVADSILNKSESPEAKRLKWITIGIAVALLVVVSLIPIIAKKLKKKT